MSYSRLSFCALPLLGIAGATGATGCFYDETFCDDVSCDGQGGQSASQTTTSATMTTTSMMQSSSSTGIDPTCIPSEPTWAPNEACGIFVKLGETGMGTPTAPFGNVAAAVAAATTAGKPIYIAEGEYEGAVVLPSGTVVFGGLKTDWSFDATVRPTITALPDEIPVKLDAGMATTELHHVRVEAKTAELEGGSSIAMVIADTPSVLESVDLIAGDGKNGANSTTPTVGIGPDMPSDPAIRGNDGSPASATDPGDETPGAPAKANAICGASVGGKGGNGGSVLAGMPATPQDAGNGGTGAVLQPGCMGNCGNAGPGHTSGNGGCMAGTQGQSGAHGDDGVANTLLGTLTSDGYVGPPPGNGTDAAPGQGGGGGGGAMGDPSPKRGASGGSGGAGGCGGKGAPGGEAGGSSIALILLGQAPTMTTVNLAIGSGGDGGIGAAGQFGVTGGAGGGPGLGSGTSNACRGGDGGQGGNGGDGAGGRGGHSIGIAYNGTAPSGGFTLTTPGLAGEGGQSNGNLGTIGESAETLDFVP